MAVLLERIRRTPGLEADADSLARHLAAVEDDTAWAIYVERMIVAMSGLNELRTVIERLVADAQVRERAEIARTEAAAVDAQRAREASEVRERVEIAKIEAGTSKFSIFSEKLFTPVVVATTTAATQIALHFLSP